MELTLLFIDGILIMNSVTYFFILDFFTFKDFDRLSPLVITRKSIVEHKSHIILPPKINCEPKPIYRWSKDGTQITEDSPVNNDFRISAEGGLYISNININAQGTYKLNIENTFMSQRNADYASQAALQIIISVTPGNLFLIFKEVVLIREIERERERP